MPDITETITNIGKAFEDFKADNEKRLVEIERRGHADPLLSEKVDKMASALASLESLKQSTERINAFEKELRNVETVLARPLSNGSFETPKSAPDPEYTKAYWDFIRHGNEDPLRQITATKAWNVTTAGDGGYTVPEEIDSQLYSLIQVLSPMRQLASVKTIGTSDYKKLVNVHGLVTEWVGETTATATDTGDFAEVTGVWGQISCRPTITQWMLDDSMFNAESELLAEISRTFAQGEATAFVTGNGTNKPKGFMDYTFASTVDGTRAFGQLQYVYTGTSGAFKTASATVSEADDIVDLLYAMKPYHRSNATIVMNALTLAKVMKWKAYVTGDTIWKPGIAQGQPSTILGFPVVEMPDMPSLGASTYPIAAGNFKDGYCILDRAFGVRTLRDPFSSKPYVEFYTTKRVGGMVIDSEAIKAIKASSS